MQDLIAAIIGFFLLNPLSSGLSEELSARNVPQEITSRVIQCTEDAWPIIIERVMAEPFWAMQSILSVWSGWGSPEAVLADIAPACASALEETRSLLETT